MAKLIVANWKVHPSISAEAINLAVASDIAGLVICPPDDFLKEVSQEINRAILGAQDLSSVERLKSFNAKYVIIGHSDRRQLGETDELIAQKIRMAVENNLVPILCVGESSAERAADKTRLVIERQLKVGLSLVTNELTNAFTIVVAYEPIWAIGTGDSDIPENTVEMSRFIRSTLSTIPYTLNPKVIYGGSVTSENAESFLRHPEIEGALVGGASLNSEEIKKIVEIARKY